MKTELSEREKVKARLWLEVFMETMRATDGSSKYASEAANKAVECVFGKE